ncbi:MAG TPA: hypothetical protein VNV65_08590 [Candidatus Solibacter sp.]|jgi:hypothetical protein|nr:hypothetical protein [Candidatus Solibacter sp.]
MYALRLGRAFLVVLGLGLPITAIIYGLDNHHPDVVTVNVAVLLVVGLLLALVRGLRRRSP